MAVLILPFLIQGILHAQQFDVAFGVGTLTAPSASSANGNHAPVSLTGGAYPVWRGLPGVQRGPSLEAAVWSKR